MTIVRQATLDDIPEAVGLGALLAVEGPTYQGLTYSPERVAATLERVIPTGGLQVAEKDGALIGYLLSELAPFWCMEGNMVCEYSLFVAKPHRRGMTAARLVRATETWARTLPDVRRIMVGMSTGINTERVVGLYEALGYVQQEIGLAKVI